jgi:putative ABC transport system permease protein
LEFLVPAFYNLDSFVSDTFLLDKSPANYLIFFGFNLLVGLAAGMVPALNIARFQPLQAIQQLSNLKVFSRIGLRKALVTVQFALSLIFILAVIIVLKQQSHVLNADLGQNIENVLNLPLQGLDYDKFSPKASQVKGVGSVSYTSVALLTGENNDEIAHFGTRGDSMEVAQSFVSQNFLENMGMTLSAGNNFPEDNRSPGEQFTIINETAARRMGYESPEAALGKPIIVAGTPLSIIGVAKDFHHNNIRFSPIKPFVLRNKSERAQNAYLRLDEGANKQETLAALQAVWAEMSPQKPWFAFYLEERVYNMAKFFRMGSSIIGFVGFLTIVIACLGLLGMVVYTVEGKVKEVGIRKVLGASDGNIVWQLSKGCLLLLGIAIAAAVPLTLFVANLWLNNFLLRISVSPVLVGSGVAMLLLLGLVPVLSQTWWAARANPVKSLRSE